MDAKNNPVPNANVTWTSTSTTAVFVDGKVIQTNQYGIATIKYTDTTYGTQTLTATIDNGEKGTVQTTFAVDPANMSISTLTR